VKCLFFSFLFFSFGFGLFPSFIFKVREFTSDGAKVPSAQIVQLIDRLFGASDPIGHKVQLLFPFKKESLSCRGKKSWEEGRVIQVRSGMILVHKDCMKMNPDIQIRK